MHTRLLRLQKRQVGFTCSGHGCGAPFIRSWSFKNLGLIPNGFLCHTQNFKGFASKSAKNLIQGCTIPSKAFGGFLQAMQIIEKVKHYKPNHWVDKPIQTHNFSCRWEKLSKASVSLQYDIKLRLSHWYEPNVVLTTSWWIEETKINFLVHICNHLQK